MPFSHVVIILFSAGLFKSAFSTFLCKTSFSSFCVMVFLVSGSFVIHFSVPCFGFDVKSRLNNICIINYALFHFVLTLYMLYTNDLLEPWRYNIRTLEHNNRVIKNMIPERF